MKRIPRELIRELITSEEFKTTGDIMEAIKGMFADVLGEVLEAELDTTLGYDKHEQHPDNEPMSRNVTGNAATPIRKPPSSS